MVTRQKADSDFASRSQYCARRRLAGLLIPRKEITMNKLATAVALLALSTGVSLAANQNPDRDPTRGFTTGVDNGEMTLDTSHTASLPLSVVAQKEEQPQSGKVVKRRAPWAGR
jgi:hypothetical protein